MQLRRSQPAVKLKKAKTVGRKTGAILIGVIAVGILAGCASSPTAVKATQSATDSAVSPSSAPATSTSTPTKPSSTPATSVPVTTGSKPVATSTPGPIVAFTSCLTSNLSAAVVKNTQSESTPGKNNLDLAVVLTNKGNVTCTLQGYPGVSLVGDGNGTQLGNAADFEKSSQGATIILKVGQKSLAPLSYFSTLNLVPSTCQTAPADGFRIYPPGQKASLFASYTGIDGCVNKTEHLLEVLPFQPDP